MSEFQKCVDFIFELEGFGAVVIDEGGLTRWGIASRFHPDVDVQNLTREGALKIYRDEYWDECDCDKYPWPMNLVIFDTAVNQGPGYAKQLAFSALDYVEALMLRVERYTESVNKHHEKLHNFHGWINRLVLIFKRVQVQ